ncbi:MAG: hypothetical protein QNL62_23660 [Gammaproteobacteria bacterium]|nr:hypothetical protein [Gammaproteobacteria bacterium]
MSQWWALIFLFLAFNVNAQSCKIEMCDLTEKIQSAKQAQVVTLSELKDPFSEEPVRRYLQPLSDGTIIIIEQKHCLMYNLTVTLLLPEGVSIDTAPSRLANILKRTQVWKKWFNTLDAGEILQGEFESMGFKSRINQKGSFSYTLDDKIKAQHENSEVLLRLVNLDSGTLPFNVVVSIYIGVGGL